MADDDAPDDHYEVGYGKPPKHTQFKPGQCGNPRGRPKKSKDVNALIQAELDEVIPAKEGGREKRITKREAIIKQLVNRAITGDSKATQFLLAHLDKHREIEPFMATEDDDVELLRAFSLPSKTADADREDDDGKS